MRSSAVALLGALLFTTAAHAAPADVENIPPDRYFEVTLSEIQQAKSSLNLTMYLIALPPNRLGSKVYRLVDALVEAMDRGVDVQVVLDRNIAWTDKSNLGFWDSAGKNAKAYRYLRERGMNVFFDNEAVFTHAKTLVIDEETVILGSANWSESAFSKNVETNVLIRSQEMAKEILQGFKGLELHQPAIKKEEVISVPWAFLKDQDLLGQMVTDHDERSFDAYLYLLKEFSADREGKLSVGYESLEEELDIRDQEESNRRRTIRRVLQRSQDKYGLIDFSHQSGEDPVVSLRGMNEQEGNVLVPLHYWEWGWDKELSFPGKVMYLLGLMYSSQSPTAPVWFRSTGDIGERHGFRRSFVEDGFMDLRRHNLIEVQPDKLNPADYSDRDANQYVLNPLYDPTELKQAFKALETKYGQSKVGKARGYVSQVYEDSDVDAVRRLIVLEEEFGVEVVQQAVEVVSKMSGNNPKKTIAYLIATIQGMGSEE